MERSYQDAAGRMERSYQDAAGRMERSYQDAAGRMERSYQDAAGRIITYAEGKNNSLGGNNCTERRLVITGNR